MQSRAQAGAALRNVRGVSVERFPIEAGHVLLFARAIGDPDPVWEGALRGSDPVPAPPTFVQASSQFDPDNVLRPKAGEAFPANKADSQPILAQLKRLIRPAVSA